MTEIKAKTNTPKIEVGEGKTKPPLQVTNEINALLRGIKDDFEVK